MVRRSHQLFCAKLCKTMNSVVLKQYVEEFLHISNNVRKLKADSFENLPIVEKVLLRLQEDNVTYQGVELINCGTPHKKVYISYRSYP